MPRGDATFEREIAPFRRARETVGFPLREPMPLDLVDRIAHMLIDRHPAGAHPRAGSSRS